MKTSSLSLAAILTLAAVIVPAQSRRPMTIDDVIALSAVSDAQISPDGRWVAYVVSRADMEQNAADPDVWLAPTTPGTPIRLTTSKKSDNQPRWSPDGKRLAFLSARDEKAQIFVMSPFGGEAEKLTDSKTPVQAFQWSPDGGRIAYVAPREPTAEEEKKEKEKDDAEVVDRNYKFSRLWIADVATRKTTELVSGDHMVSDPQWSPDGRSIAYTTVPTPKADDGSLTDIWVADVETRRPQKLVGNEGPDTAPRWAPDGRQLAFLTGPPSQPSQLRLALVPVAGGPPREVAQGFVYEPGPPAWSDGRTLVFSASVKTTTQLFTVPAAGGEPKQISSLRGVMSPPTLSRDGALAAFTKADVQHPADVHVSRLQPFDPVRLTDHNARVDEFQLGRSEVVHWRSKDGLEVEGLVIYPADFQPGTRDPTVVQIHGGPSGVWSETFPGTWNNFGHVWAGRGWVVFYPNVRGSSAYGEKFLRANVRDWGGGDYQDVQAGIDALIAQGVADPDRLAQTGWSYGGYLTAWTLTQTNRFKAVMVGAGLTNLFSMYSTNDLQRALDGYFGGEPWNDVAAYQRASAMTFIKQAKTPTLIQHGAADKRVPIGQAQELYMGLRKNGVPVELVFYPREAHALQEPRHQLDKMRRELEWFSKYVLGKTPPVPTSSK